MEEKNWKDMNGWEKAWEVTKITVGGALAIAVWVWLHAKGGQGVSVWTVGSGGKKPGSWSSGRHR